MKQEQACDSKYESHPEHQQRCKYSSELDKSSIAIGDYYMDRYAYQVCNQFSNHVDYTVVDDCLDNYTFLVDHNQCVSNTALSLFYDHFYEEEVVAPQHLNVDMGT